MVKDGDVRFPAPKKYVLIAGNRLLLAAATCHCDLVTSSRAILTGRLFTTAIWMASASDNSGMAASASWALRSPAGHRRESMATNPNARMDAARFTDARHRPAVRDCSGHPERPAGLRAGILRRSSPLQSGISSS